MYNTQKEQVDLIFIPVIPYVSIEVTAEIRKYFEANGYKNKTYEKDPEPVRGFRW